VYLELNPDSRSSCSNASYAVRLIVQPALGIVSTDADGLASAAQYGGDFTVLERLQTICFQKGQALDRYTKSLTAQIIADEHRRGLRRKIIRLKAAINRANRRYESTPCPPR